MKKLAILLSLMAFWSLNSLAQEKQFKRVEKFPSGEQTRSLIGSFLSGVKDYNAVQYTFDAPYEKAWPAIKRVAKEFAKVGGRPVVAIDEDNSRVQNGRITQDAMLGMGPGAWLDEFVIEATKLGTKTKVTVARKVIQKELTGDRPIKTQYSNSKIENWLLTQIEDEIQNSGAEEVTPDTSQGATASSASIDYSKSAPGKYINKDKEIEYLELKPDGTFYLQQRGRGFAGKYDVSGDVVTLVLGDGTAAKGKIRGNTIIADEGTNWVKTGEVPAVSSAQSEVLTNTDVLRMVEAKLPDGVIVTKIKNSKCKFDTSTDALIKLKQSGVSDAVIQVMAETTSN